MPYDNRDLGQHWLWQWLGAWWNQTVTWTNFDWPSARSSGIHQGQISWDMLKISIFDRCLKITNLRLQPHLPGTNELKCSYIWEPSQFFHSNIFNILRPRQNGHNFPGTISDAFSWFSFHRNWFLRVQLKIIQFRLRQRIGVKHLTIIWINDDSAYWCIYELSGHIMWKIDNVYLKSYKT